MFQPSYLPEIQIWLETGYIRLTCLKEEFQHKSTRYRCEILGKWTTIASSKKWAGFATYLWTHCPRQAWPRGSLIIKHYRVQVGNHNRGYWSPCIRHALKKELPFLEQINQWLGVLGDTYGMKMISLSDHRKWHNGGASWEQNANAGNVPTIISAWDSDLDGNGIFQTVYLEKER